MKVFLKEMKITYLSMSYIANYTELHGTTTKEWILTT